MATGVGRPKLSFADSSKGTKRQKAKTLRSVTSTELSYATQMSLCAESREDATKIVNKRWQVRKEDKQIVADRKKKIREEFKTKLGLLVDQPRTEGSGTSNDGYTARKLFNISKLASDITGMSKRLAADPHPAIRRWHIAPRYASIRFTNRSIDQTAAGAPAAFAALSLLHGAIHFDDSRQQLIETLLPHKL
ncbi:hypothetical protein ILUMI_03496 [Ignelater luminosus]|uniref:Uncharacterized protein n=1 Tax=Ignelater luminosus TaxID=2038154 RepID=A0A8K0DAP2_IGNLU|nr:hypothetical protein ILUMI_03496 [Ignelater luminosus]